MVTPLLTRWGYNSLALSQHLSTITDGFIHEANDIGDPAYQDEKFLNLYMGRKYNGHWQQNGQRCVITYRWVSARKT